MGRTIDVDINEILDKFTLGKAKAFDKADTSHLNLAQMLYYMMIRGSGPDVLRGVMQPSVLTRFDPTTGLPVAPVDHARYLATATASGWIAVCAPAT